MPVGGGASNGDFPSIAQLPIEFVQTGGVPLTFGGGGGTLFTAELHTDNLPGFNVWLLQVSGAGVVTPTPQFANGQLPTATPGVDWQPLALPAALVVGTPTLLNYKLGSRRHRVKLVSTGAAVVIYRITASLT